MDEQERDYLYNVYYVLGFLLGFFLGLIGILFVAFFKKGALLKKSVFERGLLHGFCIWFGLVIVASCTCILILSMRGII